jgi:hypothetical protein
VDGEEYRAVAVRAGGWLVVAVVAVGQGDVVVRVTTGHWFTASRHLLATEHFTLYESQQNP